MFLTHSHSSFRQKKLYLNKKKIPIILFSGGHFLFRRRRVSKFTHFPRKSAGSVIWREVLQFCFFLNTISEEQWWFCFHPHPRVPFLAPTHPLLTTHYPPPEGSPRPPHQPVYSRLTSPLYSPGIVQLVLLQI